MLIIDQVEGTFIDALGYIVGDSESNEGIFIDAPFGAATEMLLIAQKHHLKITSIINTHGHWDHIPSNFELHTSTHAPVLIHKADAHYLSDPETTLFNLQFHIQPIEPDAYLIDDQIIETGTLKFRVIHTPGHTPGSVCLYLEQCNVLFSGDTLFHGSIGRTDLPGSDLRTLLSSIHIKLLTLPSETVVYPGHGQSTIIGFEHLNNPFLVDNKKNY